jgi:hypothetical protein
MRKMIVTGAITAKESVTLFFADGTSETLSQDNYRTGDIVAKVLPALVANVAAGNDNGVELDLSTFSVSKDVAKLTNGNVKVEENLSGDVTVKVGGKTVDGQALLPHIERAKVDGSKGFANFMKKFGEIRRQHTCDELLKFMQNADLPFADDGAIIGYKILSKTEEEGVYVDPHTRKVRQRLGSLVYMPDSKVDGNRRVLCSTGLHIASRRYIGGFWGSERVLCLVRIQPKDVIAVPLNESSKMRVAAYHIVKVLSEADAQALVQDRSVSIHDHPEALKLLEEVVGGDHTPMIERIEVGSYGEHKITPIEVKPVQIERRKKKAAKVSRMDKPKSEITAKALRVEPKDIRVLNKMIQNKPHLADLEPKYLRKLIKAQRMLNDGASLRAIAGKLDLDRDALSRNLIKKAA